MTLLSGREDWKKGRTNLPRSIIRIHEQWVCSSTILTYWAVMTYLHSSSNSDYFVQESRAAKWECAKIHGRSWVFFETFSTRHARRDSDEFHNDSRSLAIWLALLRTEGIGNGGRREPLQLVLLLRFSVRARRKSLDDRKSLVSVTDHAVGVGTCARVAWQFRVISLRRYICKNSMTKRNFKAGSWIFKLKFVQKRRISRSYCSGSRDRSNQLAEGLHQSKISCKKRFLWKRRVGFDGGGRIDMVLRFSLFDLGNCRA